MTHDTTKDPRLQVAQMACILLKKCVKLKPGVSLRISRERVTELAADCESSVMALTYSYQEPEALVSLVSMEDLSETVSALNGAYAPLVAKSDDRTLLRANIRWCLRTLDGLKHRLIRPGTTLASGVDLVVVQVKDVERGKGFLKTRVTEDAFDYSVVTNMTAVDKKDKLAAAFLPPREIFGTVSEAMFLGPQKRPEAPGTLLTDDQVDAREATAILFQQAH